MTAMLPTPPGPAVGSPLLTQVAEAAQRHGHSEVTADAMVESCRRFILFHGKRHPRGLGLGQIDQFLEHLARSKKDRLSALEECTRSVVKIRVSLHGLHRAGVRARHATNASLNETRPCRFRQSVTRAEREHLAAKSRKTTEKPSFPEVRVTHPQLGISPISWEPRPAEFVP